MASSKVVEVTFVVSVMLSDTQNFRIILGASRRRGRSGAGRCPESVTLLGRMAVGGARHVQMERSW